MRHLALALALIFPISSFAVTPEFANQATQQGQLQIGDQLIDRDMRDFFKQLQSNQVQAVQSQQKKYYKEGDALKPQNPLAQQLQGDSDQPWGQRLTDEFRIQQANSRKDFCNGTDVGEWDKDKCLYTGEQMQTIGDVEAQGRRLEGANDNPKNLVWNANVTSGAKKYLDNIVEMSRGFTEGEVDVQPWSSDYWPIATGVTAKRYDNQEYLNATNGMKWEIMAEYFKTNEFSRTAAHYITDGGGVDAFINELSPAEKYDILVGDSAFQLTKNQIAEGEGYFRRNGKVETWMGICHGWAPAAYMDPRPTKSVQARDVRGNAINFYPDDIKALSTLKWANGITVECKGAAGCEHQAQNLQQASRFIGGRCNAKDADGGITFDAETGAVENRNSDCFDTNPSAWHKTVVNQIGVLSKSFVIDVTFDYEVWNQPVVSYKYTYFNPKTQDIADFKDAIQPKGFAGDKFAKHREANSAVKWIVGVAMDVVYEVETSPSARADDKTEYDALTKVRYIYDLELDAQGKILGGEWYNNTHPDFLWTPSEKAFAWNNVDHNDRGVKYNPAETMPTSLANLAKGREASVDGNVLKAILDGLLGRR